VSLQITIDFNRQVQKVYISLGFSPTKNLITFFWSRSKPTLNTEEPL